MLKHHTKTHIYRYAALLMMLISAFSVMAYAKTLPCESAVASAHYRNPQTGKIEDSGGESSEALGQQMSESVVDKQALAEAAPDGTYYVSLRFHLMDSISDVQFSIQKPGASSWTNISHEKTGSGKDTGDLRLQIPSKDTMIRASCMVDAMGRKVTFFITLGQFSSGNSGNFAQLDEGNVPKTKSSNQASKGDTLGLVIGGGNGESSASDAADAEDPETAMTENAASPSDIKEVSISTSVWIMFFVLVFCAQLLACLAFWGLKTLIVKLIERRKNVLPDETYADEETQLDSDNTFDFTDAMWNAGWEDTENETH